MARATTTRRACPAAVDVETIWILRALAYAPPREKSWADDFEDCGPFGPSGHADPSLLARLLGVRARRLAHLSPQVQREHLKRRLAELEGVPLRCEGLRVENVRRLAGWLGLSELEQTLLLFAVSVHTHPDWEAAATGIGELSSRRLIELLAAVLDCPRTELSQALAPEALLAVSGLLRVDHSARYLLPSKIDLLEGLADLLAEEGLTEARLIAAYLTPLPPPEHPLEAFPHLAEDAALLRTVLAAAGAEAAAGVNVLLYGWTGTGKSLFARALAAALDLPLYAVTAQGPDASPRPGRERLDAYRLAQRLLARNRRCLILFDEAEDVFPQVLHPFFGLEQRSGQQKAWVNHLLETNPVPTLWVSNAIEQIDPAFRRRFLYALELPTPPACVRASLLRRHTAGLPVREPWVRRMAADASLSPGRIAQAARLARLTGVRTSREAEAMIERGLRASARVLGLSPPGSTGPAGTLDAYDPKWVRADPPLPQILKGLAASHNAAHDSGVGTHAEARLLLYGPPGSGKSAFARHLAERLARPLLVRRASDLLGPYVGQTEAQLAAAFREAQAERAALLLDEVDSLLQRREHADHGWEVTQVNELLQQMESFAGLLLATTNRLEALDPAVLRRFDLKVRFDYLDSERVWTLFVRACTALAVRVPRNAADSLKARLANLDTLTPGDFATAVRRLRLLGTRPDARALASALEAECRLKPEAAHRPIGFLA